MRGPDIIHPDGNPQKWDGTEYVMGSFIAMDHVPGERFYLMWLPENYNLKLYQANPNPDLPPPCPTPAYTEVLTEDDY